VQYVLPADRPQQHAKQRVQYMWSYSVYYNAY